MDKNQAAPLGMNAGLGLAESRRAEVSGCKYKWEMGLDMGKSIRGLRRANPVSAQKGMLNQAVLFARLGKAT